MSTTDLTTIKYSLIQYGVLTTIITIAFGILMYLFLNILSKKGAFNPVKEYMVMERKENFRIIFYPIISALFIFWLIIGFSCWYLWGGL
jgi:hypothetical protein